MFSQEKGAVHSAVVSVTVLQTVLSWRPCRPSRSPTLGGKTTWLIVQWTSKSFHFRQCCGKLEAFLSKLYVSLNKGSIFLSSPNIVCRFKLFLPQICHTSMCSVFVTFLILLIVNKTAVSVVTFRLFLAK